MSSERGWLSKQITQTQNTHTCPCQNHAKLLLPHIQAVYEAALAWFDEECDCDGCQYPLCSAVRAAREAEEKHD